MANPTNFAGDIVVPGNIRLSGSITPAIAKANILAIAQAQIFQIPLTSFRVWDDMAALLPSAGATDDLGLVEGTFATNTPSLQTEDLKALGATSNYARVQVAVPWEYVTGDAIVLRFKAGMITTGSDGTATLNVAAYKLQDDPDDAMGSNLYAGAAVNINSLVFDDIDFALTVTTLSPGDMLDVRIQTAVADGGTGTDVIAGITSAKLLCDVR